MVLKVFTVFDSKAGAHMQPFFVNSAGLAIRSFEESVSDPKSILSRHPADFTLLEIGEYDDVKGQIEMLKAPRNLGTALQYVKQPESATPLLDRIGAR